MLRHVLTLFVLLLMSGCHAQKVTAIDEAGETIIQTVSVDQWTETWTIPISTVLATTQRKAAAAAETLSPTSTAVAEPAITAVTAAVSAGTIDNYAEYASSVSSALASESSAAWANYTATATLSGLSVNSGASSLNIQGGYYIAAPVIAFILYSA